MVFCVFIKHTVDTNIAELSMYFVCVYVCVVSEGSIQIEQGLFISAVHSGWVIGKDGMLPSFGDRIISVRIHFLGS